MLFFFFLLSNSSRTDEAYENLYVLLGSHSVFFYSQFPKDIRSISKISVNESNDFEMKIIIIIIIVVVIVDFFFFNRYIRHTKIFPLENLSKVTLRVILQ